MAPSRVKLEGLKELNRNLKQLSPKQQLSVYRGAVRKAARPMANDSKQKAKVAKFNVVFNGEVIRPGTLRDSIKVKTSKDTYGVNAYVYSDKPWALWIEKGHKIVYRPGRRGEKGRYAGRKGYKKLKYRQGAGRVVGESPAFPFMRPAFEHNDEKAIVTVQKELGRLIQRYKA